jgi:hypothetical protein
MISGTRWGMLVGIGAALGMAFHTMRRRSARLHEGRARRDQQVTEPSDESFPASDPPSHTPTMGSTVSH